MIRHFHSDYFADFADQAWLPRRSKILAFRECPTLDQWCLDYPRAEQRGGHPERAQTLAAGGKYCAFRYVLERNKPER